jgi:tetratricopeptide (TPR) repeat protein
MKQFFLYNLILVFVFLLTSCRNRKPVTKKEDYKQYLQPSSVKLHFIDGEISFWTKRLQEKPDHTAAQLKIAGLLSQRFQYSGNIHELKQADSIYLSLNQTQKFFSSSIYRNLATNAITQHQFWESKFLLDSAARLGDNLAFTILQQSDVQLELGNVYEAKRLLKRYPQQNSYEVFIREAKIYDHEGNLDEAIVLMEKALSRISKQNDESAYTWAKSNLADFYSHANRFEEAYQSYLEVLSIDPENYHCLKGIAWLAFSKDKNTTAAKEIVMFLKQQHPVPDYDLLMAEIESFENNQQEADKYKKMFEETVTNEAYGDMYNHYLFSLYIDDWSDYSKAMRIAEAEIRNRPTPQSYDLLSWVHYKTGNQKEALRIAQSFVENKCFEPETAYHLATIYKANGNNKKARNYFKEVKSSIVELGPAFSNKLN